MVLERQQHVVVSSFFRPVGLIQFRRKAKFRMVLKIRLIEFITVSILCSEFMKTARRLTVLMDSGSDNIGE